MPSFRTPHFSHTLGLAHTFPQPRDGMSTRSPDEVTSLRLRTAVGRQPRRRGAPGGGLLRGLGPWRSSVLSPWLQKRLHSLAKISPIMSTVIGRGVPQQQVPPRGAPPPRGPGSPGGKRLGRRRDSTGWPSSVDWPSGCRSEGAARVLSAESFVSSPVNPTPTRSSLGLNPPTHQILHQIPTPPPLRLRARPRTAHRRKTAPDVAR